MTTRPALRVDVVVVQNLPWPRWIERVQQVEELGYDGVWVWDHLVHRTQEPAETSPAERRPLPAGCPPVVQGTGRPALLLGSYQGSIPA